VIDHVWTVVCSNAVIDEESKNVSLHSVIEQLRIMSSPIPNGRLPLRLDIVTLWALSDFDVPAQGEGRVTFLSPSGKAMIEPYRYPIDLRQHRRHRQRGHMEMLPVEESGRHTFRVDLRLENETEWRTVAAVPLEVSFEPPDTEPVEE
jgi:hypothetical protein